MLFQLLIIEALIAAGLLTVVPTQQIQFASSVVTIGCYYIPPLCPEGPDWHGPAVGSGHTRIIIDVRVGESLLRIESVQEEDEGTYYCVCGSDSSITSSLIVNRKLLS